MSETAQDRRAERAPKTVRVLNVPVELHLASLTLMDEVLHELRLVQLGHESGIATVAGELVSVMDEILTGYSEARQAVRSQAEEALSAGTDRVDLTMHLPRDAAAAGRHLLELLEKADELCRDQQLLALAAPEDVWALRRWMIGEVSAQLEDDAEPTPCPL